MPHTILHAVVHGRVQGVLFRVHTVREAERLGLGGWVRNLSDGTVELEAVGKDDALRELHRWLRHGPPSARVLRVDADWGTRESGRAGFSIVD